MWPLAALSNWCIFHRKRAHQLVATWQDRFFSVAAERRLPLLYLCNDIIQNSRKKGPEFVAEFWTALPSVLQELVRVGPENARKAAYRIVSHPYGNRVFTKGNQRGGAYAWQCQAKVARMAAWASLLPWGPGASHQPCWST